MIQFAVKRRIVDFLDWLAHLGNRFLDFIRYMGGLWILLGQAVSITFTIPLHLWLFPRFILDWMKIHPRDIRLRQHFLDQMNKIGVTSLPLVSLTAVFTGMVLALQSAYQLIKFSAIRYTADLVALSIARELGPVLTAMVVAGRVGASITAELGTMKVTEQIDAMESMGTDPVRYLVVPRFLAAMVMLFILTVYFDFIGMVGGYLIAVYKLGISSQLYIQGTFHALVHKDVLTGLFKSWVFGIIISIVGCYQGFTAQGGAEGVGRATTLSVVTSLITIIAADCFFTAFFYFVMK